MDKEIETQREWWVSYIKKQGYQMMQADFKPIFSMSSKILQLP